MPVSKLALSFYLVVVATSAACGGGSDSRSETAPPLPFPRQNAACSEFDDRSDGSIDAVYTYKYDSGGFLTESATQGSVAKWVYGKDHFTTHFEVEQTGAAPPELSEDTERDGDGRPLRVTSTEIGSDTTVTVDTFTYDSQGRATQQSKMETTTPTGGAPTTQTATATITYAGDDIIPSVVVSISGGVTTRSTYVQSNGGRAVEITVDEGDDGTVDRVSSQTFDAEGRVLTQTDTEAGMVSLRTTSTYDNRGAELTFALDFDGTDPVDIVDTTTYAAGMRTREVLASPSNNFAQFIFTENWKDTCGAAATRTTAPRARDHIRGRSALLRSPSY